MAYTSVAACEAPGAIRMPLRRARSAQIAFLCALSEYTRQSRRPVRARIASRPVTVGSTRFESAVVRFRLGRRVAEEVDVVAYSVGEARSFALTGGVGSTRALPSGSPA